MPKWLRQDHKSQTRQIIFVSDKRSSLIGQSLNDKVKTFYNIDCRGQCYKFFTLVMNSVQ